MYKFLTKHGTGVAFGLGLLVTVIGLIAIIGGMESFNSLAEEDQITTGIFDAALYSTFVLFIATVVVAIGFGLFQLISSPKHAIKFAIALVGLVVLGFLFYSLSEVETSGKVYEKIQEGELSGGMSKILNGALWTTIALSLIAILGIVVSEIRNLFK
jgi:hypothetical protein